MEFILVTGTTFSLALPRYRAFRRAADMTGRALARSAFGLVTGNPPGVDSLASEAFWAECQRLGRAAPEAYRQLWLLHWLRGYWLPGKGFPAPEASTERLASKRERIERAITLAGAGVMIGGRSGALGIAERFIDAGKPVLPIPFVGGESRNVFDAILRTWDAAPVPGLSQSQFLRLAIPWISDTGALATLLLGTLSETADVFVSYRRSDSGLAAGRLHGDLVDQFGKRRIFMDLHGIAPSADWLATIDAAVTASKIGIVIIGPNWLATDAGGHTRLSDSTDIVRRELRGLLDGRKRLLPVLMGGAQLPPSRGHAGRAASPERASSDTDRQRQLVDRHEANRRGDRIRNRRRRADWCARASAVARKRVVVVSGELRDRGCRSTSIRLTPPSPRR